MSKFNSTLIARRKLLAQALLGGIGGALALKQLGSLWKIAESPGEVFRNTLPNNLPYSHDSFQLLADAMAGGSSLLRMERAFAEGSAEQWSLVTIKIANHVHAPLVFKFGSENSINPAKPIDKIFNKHASYADLDVLSVDPILKKLRVNKWFGDILTTRAAEESGNRGLTAAMQNKFFAPLNFSTQNVALQCAFHLQQSVSGQNHSMRGFKMRETLPDLSKWVIDKGILTSPLGLTCFMMGDRYDKAEGANFINIICDMQGETPFLNGKSVNAYYQNFKQSQSSYVTDPNFTLTKTFDSLVKADGGKLRSNMLQYQEVLKSQLDGFGTAASFESMFANESISAGQSAMQSTGHGLDGKPASSEFLAQCAFTAHALKISDKPLRNFSLFLNVSDLDGQNLDASYDGGAGAGVRALTYVEGMRQLAMGLNIFGKAINEGAKVIVMVISEGGRSQAMIDDKVSFGLVMAPKNPLQSALYCNLPAIKTDTGLTVIDSGSTANGSLSWNTPGLMTSASFPIAESEKILPTQGDLQLGVARFLAERSGVSLDMQGLGNYVDLKLGILPD